MTNEKPRNNQLFWSFHSSSIHFLSSFSFLTLTSSVSHSLNCSVLLLWLLKPDPQSRLSVWRTCTLEVSLWVPCSRRRLLLPRRRKLKERRSGCPLSMLHRHTAHACQSPQRGRGQHSICIIQLCQASPSPPRACHQTHWGDCRGEGGTECRRKERDR